MGQTCGAASRKTVSIVRPWLCWMMMVVWWCGGGDDDDGGDDAV
jgi:hypothetical protein